MVDTLPRRAARRCRATTRAGCTLLVAASILVAAPGHGADAAGSIDHVEAEAGALQVLYSVPGLAAGTSPDLDSLQVSINDQPVEAVAEVAGTAGRATVRRTAVITFDASNSMRGERFTQAKAAAQAYLDAVPEDVLVGLVAFADEVETLQEPTPDHDRLREAIDDLELSPKTRLYDGVVEALETAGSDGQRRLLVLSDGKDTSKTAIGEVTEVVRESGVNTDVVALEQSARARKALEKLATAGDGSLLTADEPDALVELFSEEAADLANQLLVEVTVPDGLAGTEGTLAVSIEADGDTYSDSAFVTLQQASAPESGAEQPATPQAASAPRFSISRDLMLVGMGGIALGGLLVLAMALGVFKRRPKTTLEDRVAAYTKTGDPRAAFQVGAATPTSAGSSKGLTDSAVGVAEKALSSSKGLESTLGSRLDAAGLSLKPAEWLLLHAGSAVGGSVVGFLFTGGNPFITAVAFAAGVVVPWLYLGLKKGRRLKAFDSHLPDTLQLMSGSLSAGLSLTQSVDTVVREGSQPIAGEFRRALIEARLGVQIEDALDSVAIRMDSEDFTWIVMAIRIQREVGGNLADLLLKVASTMREREYLRRQVKSLSAEGRLSAIIIGGLPPAFVLYLSVVNPTYLKPLLADVRGWMMIGIMCALMSVGGFWMSRVVKVKV